MSPPKELKAIQKILPRLIQIVRHDFFSQATFKRQKRDRTIFTETDAKVEQLILEAIKTNFPQDRILSEESLSRTKKEYPRLWVIDPLCGSGNFASGIFFFNTNVAFFEKNKPVFSLFIDYPQETYYWASEKNPGVYQEKTRVLAKIAVGQEEFINTDVGYLITKNSPQLKNFAKIVHDLTNAGFYLDFMGTSLTFNYTALGKIGALVAVDLKPWDIVASCYLMEKNGGIVTDFVGRTWKLDSYSFIGSLDKNLHAKILDIVQRNW